MRSAGLLLLYLAAAVGGTYQTFRPTFDTHFAHVQADHGDTALNHYILEHTWRVVSDPGYHGTLLSPPMFYPAKMTLAYSENLIGVAPAYWGLRLVLPEDLAFQWWMILLNLPNLAAFALAARWLGCGPLPALLGGYLWAFGVVHIDQVKHAQLIPRFWAPFAVYHAWRLAERPSLRSLNWMVAFTFLQTTACIYTGWFLSAGLAVFFPAAVGYRASGWRELVRFARARWRGVAGMLGLWGLVFGLFFAPYVLANRGAARAYEDCVDTLPTLAAWVSGPDGSAWVDTLAPVRQTASEECNLFCGFALYALMLAAGGHAWRRQHDPHPRPETVLITACVVTAGVWWLLTLNVGADLSAWWAVRFAPGGQAIRCVSRVYLVFYLFGGLAAVRWLTLAAGRVRPGWPRAAVLAAVCAAVLAEQTGVRPQSAAKDEFFPLVDRIAAGFRQADIGYVIPKSCRPHPRFGDAPVYGDILGMWAGLRANVPTVNGYSGRTPPGYGFFAVDPELELREWLCGRFRGRIALIDPRRPDQVKILVYE